MCDLHQSRRNIVFGSGNPCAKLLIVTSAPTSGEDKAGSHVTRDLMWLTKIYKRVTRGRANLETTAEHMLKEIFIVSAVMCRPLHTEGPHEGQERKPSNKEIKTCRPRLIDTIYAVDPWVIIGFGAQAIRALHGAKTGIDRAGKELSYIEVPGMLGGLLRYSVLTAHGLEVAEAAGDYDYEEGKVASVLNALRRGLDIVALMGEEDTP